MWIPASFSEPGLLYPAASVSPHKQFRQLGAARRVCLERVRFGKDVGAGRLWIVLQSDSDESLTNSTVLYRHGVGHFKGHEWEQRHCSLYTVADPGNAADNCRS